MPRAGSRGRPRLTILAPSFPLGPGGSKASQQLQGPRGAAPGGLAPPPPPPPPPLQCGRDTFPWSLFVSPTERGEGCSSPGGKVGGPVLSFKPAEARSPEPRCRLASGGGACFPRHGPLSPSRCRRKFIPWQEEPPIFLQEGKTLLVYCLKP